MKRQRVIIILTGLAAVAVIAALAVYAANNQAVFAPYTTPSPSVSSSATPSVSPTPGATDWLTGPSQQTFAGSVPPVPPLSAIRPGQHPEGSYDRISFDFHGAAAPGYQIGYVSQVVRDGSGAPVTLTGPFYLQLVFSPATAHTDGGGSTLSSPPTNPVATGFAGLTAYVLNGDNEGQVSIALGLATKTGYQIHTLKGAGDLWTIYVDVPRP